MEEVIKAAFVPNFPLLGAEKLEKRKKFIPERFKVTLWSKLKPFCEELVNRPIESAEDLENWVLDRNELEALISESLSWRYIKISADSNDQKAAKSYQYTIEKISPKVSFYSNLLDRKLTASPFLPLLDVQKYKIYLRNIQNALDLFRQENIPIYTKVQLKSKAYGKLFSEMTIGVDGKQMTLQKAGALLEEADRSKREGVFHKINQRILAEQPQFEDLFDDLLKMRHQIATQSGFSNFRDFKFRALGRFDYSVTECEDFHHAIRVKILPIIDDLNVYRQKTLGLEVLRPWDLYVDVNGEAPLRVFENAGDFVSKAIDCLSKLNPLFGHVLSLMESLKHLDLESRPGKRPGGYNMPLLATGVPFIFMNATNSLADLRTLMHECGHAIHSYLTKNYPINTSKRVPSEVAELASMTMELLTMQHWSVFFEDAESLKRAKIIQLENILRILPWIATVDKFQHWIYTNPSHSREERKENWIRIYKEFNSDVVNQKNLEHYAEFLWHKQLHIFEVPFYYIEYGMAQLGAVAIWKNFQKNPEKTLQQFIQAMQLGYTKPIKEIYQTAGISFDFSEQYIGELADFVRHQLFELL